MDLKTARINTGLTLKELSEKTGLSESALCRYENGTRTPSVETAKKIGGILDVPWFWIMDNKKAAPDNGGADGESA